mmetsp:Transcript_25836/g.65743  ORF Transcript_25836/g.65743 Transcript_25836/m.65743 type:complete len:259 (-) Transcript_25836:40-816(-)
MSHLEVAVGILHPGAIVLGLLPTLLLDVRGPEGQVISQELHDESGILVRLLVEGVELRDGVVEGLLGQVAGAIGRVEDLVVEDGEVERQAEADGVGGGEVGEGNVLSRLVRDERVLGRLLAAGAGSELGEVAPVVSLHLVVEHLGLASGRRGDEVAVEDGEDVVTDARELVLDLLAVLLDLGDVLLVALVLLLLLDAGDDARRRTAGADDVLVGDREEVTLLNGELDVHLGHGLHGLDHLVVALGLLRQLGHVDILLA